MKVSPPAAVLPDTATLASRSAWALRWGWAGAATRALLQLFVQIVLARLLGPQAFGQAAAALLVVSIGWLLAEGGHGAALIQKAELHAQDLALALGRVLLGSAVVALVVAAGAPLLAAWLGQEPVQAQVLVPGQQPGQPLLPWIWASAAIIPLQALSHLPMCLMQRSFDIKRLQFIQLASYVVAYGVVGLALALWGLGGWSIVAAFGVHALLVGVMGARCVHQIGWPRWAWAVPTQAFARRVTAANLVNAGLDSLDRMFVSRFWGTAALGEYALAANLARAPVTLLVSSVQSVAFASASRLQAEHERMARGYLSVLALALLVTGPVFVFLALHAQAVVVLLYGSAWAGSAPLFAALCAGVPFFVAVAVTGPMLWGLGAVWAEARVQLLVLLMMVTALVMMAALPLPLVVWLMPALALMRAAVLYRALARRIVLPPWAWARAGAAGAACAAVVMACTAVVETTGAGALASAFATAVAALLMGAALLRWRGAVLLSPPLRQALLQRCADSALARRACGWLGLHA